MSPFAFFLWFLPSALCWVVGFHLRSVAVYVGDHRDRWGLIILGFGSGWFLAGPGG